MKTFEEQEIERFQALPIEARNAATEYYGYMAAMHKGVKLTAGSVKRVKELVPTIEKHKITPLCFEADLFPDN